jgi:hypothetical protein
MRNRAVINTLMGCNIVMSLSNYLFGISLYTLYFTGLKNGLAHLKRPIPSDMLIHFKITDYLGDFAFGSFFPNLIFIAYLLSLNCEKKGKIIFLSAFFFFGFCVLIYILKINADALAWFLD